MRHVGMRSLVAVVALSAACSSLPAHDAATLSAVPPDPGAASRQAVLDRYLDGAREVALTTPSIVGRSPGSAQSLLDDHGLDIRLVAFDPQRPVTVQHPQAGQPAPIDGVVEAWLGRPPEEVEVVEEDSAVEVPGPPAVDPQPTASPTMPADTPAEGVQTAADGGSAPAPAAQEPARYILPPHTDGLLRTNPRMLPAVPLGTELTGNASWYGPGFHGLTTACGGTFDQNAATVATRELRCGTVVRITGPTGLTVEATVTDWGPAEWTNRRFDLSAAVFNAIAPLGAGVVPVRIVTASVPR